MSRGITTEVVTTNRNVVLEVWPPGPKIEKKITDGVGPHRFKSRLN
ncbi:MAG: hypothetical protein ACRC8Y_08120 [Chroococcales cyanobacterium]